MTRSGLPDDPDPKKAMSRLCSNTPITSLEPGVQIWTVAAAQPNARKAPYFQVQDE